MLVPCPRHSGISGLPGVLRARRGVAVEALAEEWLEGMLPGTEHAVSPHRTKYFRELISDWQDDPVTDAALALLPEWVHWNGEQAGVSALLVDEPSHPRPRARTNQPDVAQGSNGCPNGPHCSRKYSMILLACS
jgi:hypothetical protein